jgi:undecaprenyl-diphosphatase
MAVPVIAGAAVLELPKLGAGVQRVGLGPLVLSCLTALVGGIVAIKLLVRMLERGAFYRFAPYCWAIGVGTILWALRS